MNQTCDHTPIVPSVTPSIPKEAPSDMKKKLTIITWTVVGILIAAVLVFLGLGN